MYLRTSKGHIYMPPLTSYIYLIISTFRTTIESYIRISNIKRGRLILKYDINIRAGCTSVLTIFSGILERIMSQNILIAVHRR